MVLQTALIRFTPAQWVTYCVNKESDATGTGRGQDPKLTINLGSIFRPHHSCTFCTTSIVLYTSTGTEYKIQSIELDQSYVGRNLKVGSDFGFFSDLIQLFDHKTTGPLWVRKPVPKSIVDFCSMSWAITQNEKLVLFTDPFQNPGNKKLSQ